MFPSPSRRVAAVTIVLSLAALAAGCGDKDATPSATDNSSISSTPSPTESSGEEVSASPTAVEGVSPADSLAFMTALETVGTKFSQFVDDFEKARKAKDAPGVFDAAAQLSAGLSELEKSVGVLDLSAVQPSADALQEITRRLITGLEAVDQAGSGSEAVSLLNALPVNDFLDALQGLAEDIAAAGAS